MKQIKDIDYIFLSTRIKAMERGLLSKERIERMLDAPTTEEAVKVLTECGYSEMSAVTAAELERVLAEQQKKVMADLSSGAPDKNIVDIFKLRYDYHNAKVLVKAGALGIEQDHLLQGGGRYDAETLAADFRREDMSGYTDFFRRGISRAREIGTFETSILPYEDCCTVFTPRHPKTKPHVEEVRELESVLDIEGLVERALAEREIVKLKI